MKFVRFGPRGSERPGVLVDDATVVDISSLVPDIGPQSISRLSEVTRQIGRAEGLEELPVDSVRLGSPIARPHKIIGIGFNYVDHASEAKVEIPTEPIVFLKATSSLSGPYDDVLMPPHAEKLDWEVELGLVIGETARYLDDEAAAKSVVAGFTVAHDVSERYNQIERGGQWTKGKSSDTFSPVGPWLVTPDEVGDIGDLALTCRVNGETRQSGSTSMMIFAPYYLVWYLSQFMTLEPGDLVMTGTPPGVALSTGDYLVEGDVVELEVEGLGRQRQVIRAL